MIQRGASRIVVMIGGLAIKFPSFHNGPLYFLYGMIGNRLEWQHWHMSRHERLAQVYWCGPLGCVLAMKRYKTILDRPLTRDEVALFPFINLDNNGANVADDNGYLVLIDYGDQSAYIVLA